MFIDILRSAENSAKVTKEVITYKADGNGIKTVKKELLSLAEVYHDNSINGLFADATEPENNGIIIYKDFSPCLEVAKVWNTPTAEQMQKALQNYNGKMGTFSDFENMIKNAIAAESAVAINIAAAPGPSGIMPNIPGLTAKM